MSNVLSIAKDVIISAIIAVLTSGLFEVSNIIYQSIITVLILIIIFLILRGIDKLAKRLEILSILYVEHLIIPLQNIIAKNGGVKLHGKLIENVKVFIVLPEELAEVIEIKKQLNSLEKFSLGQSEITNRALLVTGKLINNEQLLIFDTPVTWTAGLGNLNKAKGMSTKKFSKLIIKMTRDIKSYIEKLPENTLDERNLNFISLREFQNFFN